MAPWILGAAAFVAMEPVTAATHRFVMHGIGMRLHRSHHRHASGRLEANDAFPVMFAALVCLGMWVGFNAPSWSELVPVGVGITAYGALYALVHDLYIHRRLRLFGDRRITPLDRLAEAHALHHRFGGAPFGMLVPIVPTRVRQLAELGREEARSTRETGRLLRRHLAEPAPRSGSGGNGTQIYPANPGESPPSARVLRSGNAA